MSTITGSSGDDTLDGGSGSDTLLGGTGDDTLNGGSGSDILLGGSGDDTLNGGAGSDLLLGGSGDDTLNGGAGSDLLDGGNGDDDLNGGSGDDILLGGNGSDSLSGGSGDDYLLGGNGGDTLNGGTGDDVVLGQNGSDTLIYNMSQNLGSIDYYDAGQGYDTLVLQLTYGEFLLASVQQDIVAFQALLGSSTTYEFSSFDLTALKFEHLQVVLVNHGPAAAADEAATGEDDAITIDVLANDSDPDHLDLLSIAGAGASARGATITTDGSAISYDPGAALQWLAQGQVATDTFTYTIKDLGGLMCTETVTVTVTGENDAPTIVGAHGSGVTENPELLEGGTLTGEGTILFHDVDAIDTHTVTAVSQGADYRGQFSLVLDNDSDTVAWTFTVDDLTLDELAHGQVVSQFYDVLIDDGLASVTRTVEITLTGANDAPTFVGGDLSGAAAEAAAGSEGGTHSDQGTIVLDDVDTSDTHGATVAMQGGSYLGQFSLQVDQGANTVGWLFSVDDSELDALAQGEIVKQLYDVTVSDGLASFTRTVEITLTGADEVVEDVPAVVARQVPFGFDLIYFMRAEGHTEWMQLDSFEFGLSHPEAAGASGADLKVLMSTGSGAAKLFAAAAAGQAIGAVEIEAYTIDMQPQLVDEFRLENVHVTGHEALGTGIDGVQHGISFSYQTIGHTHVQEDGTATGTTIGIGSTTTGEGPAAAPDAFTGSFESQAAGEMRFFLRLDGVGDANEWLSLGSCRFGLENPAGDAQFSDLTVTLGSSSELVQLATLLASGTHIASGEIEVYDWRDRIIDEFKLEDILVTGLVSSNGMAGNSLSLDFAAIEYGHQTYDGDPGVFIGHQPTPDAMAGRPANEIPGFALQYFMRASGTDWIELKGFSFGMESSGSTGSAGEASATEVTAVMRAGSGGAKLLEAARASTVFGSVEVEAYLWGQLVDEFVFGNVVVSGYNAKDGALHEVTLDYAKLGHTHVEYLGAPSATGMSWDFDAKAGEVSGLLPTAEASGGAKESPVGVDLQYFLRVDTDGGPGEWLEIGSYRFGVASSAGSAPVMSDVSVTLGSSNGLVELARLLAQGTEVEGAEIEVYSIGRIVDEFQFSGDVAMTALKSVDATENELSFSFTGFAQGHQTYDTSGAQAGTVGHAPDPEALGAPPAPDVTSPPSLQYFMRAHGLTDWIELKGFSFDMANASGDGGGLVMSDVIATMSTGSGAAKLFQAMAEGRPIASIEIEAYTRDAAPQLVDEFTFDSAQLTRHEVDTQAEVGTSHTVHFGFAEFGHTHVEQRDAAGNIISQESMTTDASDPTGPAATPDALQGARETVVGSKLESYLRVEGVGAPNEWLLLNSYSLALENPASGAGSAVLRDLEVGVGSSGTLVELTDALASGRLFDYAELEVYRLFEGAKIIDEFKFEDLAVSELLSTTATRNTLAFDYADVSYAHATTYDAETGEVAGWAGGHTPDADLF